MVAKTAQPEVSTEPEVPEVPEVTEAEIHEPDPIARAQDPTQTPTVTNEDGLEVNPAVPDPRGAEEVPPFISEGVAKDIEMHGYSVDPVSGRRLTAADLPAGR